MSNSCVPFSPGGSHGTCSITLNGMLLSNEWMHLCYKHVHSLSTHCFSGTFWRPWSTDPHEWEPRLQGWHRALMGLPGNMFWWMSLSSCFFSSMGWDGQCWTSLGFRRSTPPEHARSQPWEWGKGEQDLWIHCPAKSLRAFAEKLAETGILAYLVG